MSVRSYSELSKLKTFKERFRYLKLNGSVAEDTFGFDRYLNQEFYRGYEWKKIRREVIIRDMGCDLGLEGFDIRGKVIIHHMNPLTKYDLVNRTEFLIDPEYLVCVSMQTHNAIHYGDESMLSNQKLTERSPNDTCPWKRGD